MTKNNRFSPTSEKGHFYGLVDEGKYLRQSLLYKQILPRPVRRSFSEGGTQSRLKTLCSLWLYSSCSSCASWLKNPFNQCKPRLIKRLTTTKDYVRNYKQNMQNKANFPDTQMNASLFITMNYEHRTMNYEIKNKANSNPKQTQYKANTNPIQSQYKPNTKPNKANFRAKKCCCL